MRILVVEDSPADFRLIRELLQDVSNVRFALTHVVLLSEALTQLEHETFDVVLLDLSLPDSHGIDTFNAISEKSYNIPIVILSGFNDEVFAIKAVQKGAQDYLIKGQVTGSQLMRALRYSVERKGMEDALRKAYEIMEKRVHERTAELEMLHAQLYEKDSRLFDMERKLLASDVVIASLMEKVHGCFYWKSVDGHYVLGNDNFVRLAGLAAAEELVGKTENDLPADKVLREGWKFFESVIYDPEGNALGSICFFNAK